MQTFPGSERAPTLAEVQEIQRRLTALGFDTGGTDGRIGNDTMLAVRVSAQGRHGAADGYAGVNLLARLRRGPRNLQAAHQPLHPNSPCGSVAEE